MLFVISGVVTSKIRRSIDKHHRESLNKTVMVFQQLVRRTIWPPKSEAFGIDMNDLCILYFIWHIMFSLIQILDTHHHLFIKKNIRQNLQIWSNLLLFFLHFWRSANSHPLPSFWGKRRPRAPQRRQRRMIHGNRCRVFFEIHDRRSW